MISSICCCEIGSSVGTTVGTFGGVAVDGMSVGTEVGVAVGVGMTDGDGSDVDGDKGFRCHGPCGMGVGDVVGVGGSSSSSSSINTGNGAFTSVKWLILGDGAWTYFRPFLIALR